MTADALPQAAAGVVAGTSPAPRRRRSLAWLGTVPLLAYLGVFLLLPTAVVVVGAFGDADNRFTMGNLHALTEPTIRHAFVQSILLSVFSAVIGAVLGAILTWAVAGSDPDGWTRRIVTSAAGVLAQFGGVVLAFAFIVTVGSSGFVTLLLQHAGIEISGTWLYELPGLVLVYAYFQIPLMVLVFLPAMEGVRPQWREAAESLGGTGRQFWWYVGIPILAPSFLGALLLLFANAFAAYATAAALVTQGSPTAPLQIRTALTSEVILGQANVGKALALGMVVIVAIAMTLYALLQRRGARWLR